MARSRAHRGLRAVALLPALLGFASGCNRQPPTNLIVLLIDTLRADHLGCYGYERPTSPHIDAFAAESYVFDHAIAQSSWTGPSVASLFTSTYPSVHGVHSFQAALPSSCETLAHVLQQAGYNTGAVSSNFVHITAQKGFGQGFDSFEELMRRAEPGNQAEFLGFSPADASEVTDHAISWLNQHSQAPFFLYVHYMDPHSGYEPPPALRARFARPYTGPIDGSTAQITRIESGRLPIDERGVEHLVDLYDAEIAAVDDGIGRLLTHLQSHGLTSNSLIVLLADHGEEFHDHGGLFHGYTLYREMVRVPLIIRLPGRGTAAGQHLAPVVQLVDVGPTLLEVLRHPDPRTTQGRSFAGFLARQGTAPWSGKAYSELFDDPTVDAQVHPKRHKLAFTTSRWSYLVGRQGGAELYDLSTDPTQQANRLAAEPAIVADLQRESKVYEQPFAGACRPQALPPATLSGQEREKLRALGYVE